jgi:protein gp37
MYSKIEWTEATWNPTTGCKKISPACDNCYAETFAERFRGVKGHHYENGFDIKLWPKRLHLPLSWKKGKMIFVDSMSDLFLDEIPDGFRNSVFQTMEKANWHTFQVLTKRPHELVEWYSQNYGLVGQEKKKLPDNVWLGVSVENNEYLFRIELLKIIPAKIKFISFEPLLGPVKLDNNLLEGINWVIVGGESGSKARRMKTEWIDDVYNECYRLNIPFFFKQWGTYNEKGEKLGKSKSGRIYQGKEWNEMP